MVISKYEPKLIFKKKKIYLEQDRIMYKNRYFVLTITKVKETRIQRFLAKRTIKHSKDRQK